jgi:hypothetical protein
MKRDYVSPIFWIGFSIAAIFAPYCSAADAVPSRCWKDIPRLTIASTPSICSDPSENAQVKNALSLVCLENPAEEHLATSQRVIVIGFLGGFVGHGEPNHPEVWFAAYLRQHFHSEIYAEAFSNREGDEALRDVLSLLDINCNGVVSESEKRNARIILYGHSWGASETVAFARELEKRGIPVLLTVQIDIVPKPGQNATAIPRNVEKAVNFYQSKGPIHGLTRIVASDSAKTEIIGNYGMSYGNHHIDCGNFPWFPRTFDKPHHEIENDPRIWQRINTLIDVDVRGKSSAQLRSTGAKSMQAMK